MNIDVYTLPQYPQEGILLNGRIESLRFSRCFLFHQESQPGPVCRLENIKYQYLYNNVGSSRRIEEPVETSSAAHRWKMKHVCCRRQPAAGKKEKENFRYSSWYTQ